MWVISVRTLCFIYLHQSSSVLNVNGSHDIWMAEHTENAKSFFFVSFLTKQNQSHNKLLANIQIAYYKITLIKIPLLLSLWPLLPLLLANDLPTWYTKWDKLKIENKVHLERRKKERESWKIINRIRWKNKRDDRVMAALERKRVCVCVSTDRMKKKWYYL